ncbi:ArsR/SmtB family transcription factor [Gimibacter soli]|uniref:Metalloregulator ArsR/SmtB family transcription factor n=1 Tax=Gimibacter soli TaxID=3024400 RepID=A0AAF0BNA7_9PROT|nr:metalloregulator ArsR/SmtB family transcription factor [Gimibacter soli]WCL55800.1 metalloregulator ArsR/SmtB family transcription factor [Gimibacter soli]
MAFRGLADPTRRQIMVMLTDHDQSIGEISEQFNMTRAAVKKHLTILEEGGLIRVRKSGRERINQIDPSGFQAIQFWLRQFDSIWAGRLQRLIAAAEAAEAAQNSKPEG